MCRNWQTRQTQNLLSEMACGFDSHHRHQKRETSFLKGGSLFFVRESNPERATSVKKRLIIVFSDVGAQTGTARLRAVVKQARRVATVSHHRHQKREASFLKGGSLFFVRESNPERATSVKKRLIIVFSDVGAQTGTARLRAVVKQARRVATVSHHRHQKEKHPF